jgi:CBS domain-containing protein
MKVTLSEILDIKGREVWSVSPQNSAFEALVVINQGKVVGMFSERDYARKVTLLGKSSKETPVADVMSTPVISINPGSSIDECMTLMTTRHIRHLPIIENDKPFGIVSIGDVVKAVISEQKSVINELKGFVDEALKDRVD